MAIARESVWKTGGAQRPRLAREECAGWRARLALRYEQRRGRTVLASCQKEGPLAVQRAFYPEGDAVCHTYLLHPPAGIVGGDDLGLRFDLDSNAHALLTTPGATRFYWSRGDVATLDHHARVAEGAALEWLPQETLVFDGAHVRATTRIDLEAGARVSAWEIVGLGRPACDERFVSGEIDFRIELWRDGEPLLLERLRGARGGLAGLRSHAACATFLATGASEAVLGAARGALASAKDALCAATLIDDLLVARGLAARCEPLESAFRCLWATTRPFIFGRTATPPRIWQT